MFSIVPRGAKFDVGSIAMQSGNFRNKASRQGLESTSLEGAEILQPVAATAHHGVLARLGLRGDGRHACWGLKAPSAVGWISAVPSVPFRSGAHQGCGAARQVCYSRAGTVLRGCSAVRNVCGHLTSATESLACVHQCQAALFGPLPSVFVWAHMHACANGSKTQYCITRAGI